MCPFSKDTHTHTHSLTACQWSCVHPEGMFVCDCVFRHCFFILILLWLARLGENPIITSHIDPHTLIHPYHSPSGGISEQSVCVCGLGVWNTPSPLLYARGHMIYRSTWEKDRKWLLIVHICTECFWFIFYHCWFIFLGNKRICHIVKLVTVKGCGSALNAVPATLSDMVKIIINKNNIIYSAQIYYT